MQDIFVLKDFCVREEKKLINISTNSRRTKTNFLQLVHIMCKGKKKRKYRLVKFV